MESDGNVSNKQVKQNPEFQNEDDKPLPEAKFPHIPSASSSSSSSSSSSISSSFGSDNNEKIPLEDLPAKSELDGNLSSSPDNNPTTPQWSLVSASPTPSGFTPMKSPSSQIMGRSTGYDPNRIPTSIFSTKASNPDWSTASNESLFSIQMGNNSFTREHSAWLEEWNNSHVSEPLPPVMEESSVRSRNGSIIEKEEEFGASFHVTSKVEDESSMGYGASFHTTSKVEDESSMGYGASFHTTSKVEDESSMGYGSSFHTTSKVEDESSMENHFKVKIAPVEPVKGNTNDETYRPSPSSSTPQTSFNDSRLSAESGNSAKSFAFPVLISDSKNISKNDSSRNTAVTEKPDIQQSEEQVEEVTPPPNNASEQKGWFSCFSCSCCIWPKCCCC